LAKPLPWQTLSAYGLAIALFRRAGTYPLLS